MPVSYYADPSVWVQRSWPGLAGATGEQMRTVGARFNLAKHYRMRCAPVPGKDKLNFSHCASHSSFQWVESHQKMSNRVKKKKKKALDTELVSLRLSCCFFYFVGDSFRQRQTSI